MKPTIGRDPIDPTTFLQVIGCMTERVVDNKLRPGFNGDKMADASEFLTALLNLVVEEDMHESGSTDRMSTMVGRLLGGTTYQTVRTSPTLLREKGSILILLQLKCGNCSWFSEVETPFLSPLPVKMSCNMSPTVQDCLDTLLEDEHIEDFKCECCEAKEIRKSMYGGKLPRYLAIEINRTGFKHGRSYKIQKGLRIDTGVIDMSRWWPDSSPDSDYEICAVAEHYGPR